MLLPLPLPHAMDPTRLDPLHLVYPPDSESLRRPLLDPPDYGSLRRLVGLRDPLWLMDSPDYGSLKQRMEAPGSDSPEQRGPRRSDLECRHSVLQLPTAE